MEIGSKWEEGGTTRCEREEEDQGSKDRPDHKEREEMKDFEEEHNDPGNAEESTEAKASESNERNDEEAEGQIRGVPDGEQTLQWPQRKRSRHREPPGVLKASIRADRRLVRADKRVAVQIPAVDASAATNENADAEPGSTLADIWKMLPEELFDIIPSRLPFASQRRFRCVGKKWRRLQCVPPSHATLSKLEDQKAVFHCEAERKWFRLPPSNPPVLGWTLLKDIKEEVIDVNGGIVCYQTLEVDKLEWEIRYWVCNPLSSSTARLIPPIYVTKDSRKPPKVKVVVDRAKKTFKLVVVPDGLSWTNVFHSATLRWFYELGSHPRLQSLELFLWDNVVHAFSTKPKLGLRECLVVAFNTESGTWSDIEVEIPSSGFGVPAHQFFVSDNNQLFVVQFWYTKRARPCLSVWKFLRSSMSSDIQYVKLDRWQNIIRALEGAEVGGFAGHRLTSVCCGPEYMCFGFSDDEIKDNAFRTHKCVRYSFAAKTWSMMQCPGTRGWGGNSTLYNWEPNLDLDFSNETPFILP